MTPYQKRLLWLLQTFGRRYPRQVSDTVQMLLLVEPTVRYGPATVQWWEKAFNPLETEVRAEWISIARDDPVGYFANVVAGIEAPRRGVMDRWGRWLLDEVRRAYRARPKPLSPRQAAEFHASLVGMVNPFKATPARRLTYSPVETRAGFRTARRATRKELATQQRLMLIWRSLPRIREWLSITGASLSRLSLRQAVRAAEEWHQAAISAALSDVRRIAGLGSAREVGTLPNGWRLVQLTTQAELQAEGATLHHCVGGYWPRVRDGQVAIYSLRTAANEPRATLEVAPEETRFPDLGSGPGSGPFRGVGVVTQAKGLRNNPLGFGRRLGLSLSALRGSNISELEAAGADLELLAIALTAVQDQGWNWESPYDMGGVVALRNALEAEAAGTLDPRHGKKTPGRGRRAIALTREQAEALGRSLVPVLAPAPRRTAGLSYRDAAAILARARRPDKGVALSGGFRLSREVRSSPEGLVTVYAIRTKRPEIWWTRTKERRESKRRGYSVERYRWLEHTMPTTWAVVEIWPTRWVVRGRAARLENDAAQRPVRSGSRLAPYSFPGAQYSPLTLIGVPKRMFEMDLRPPMAQVGPTSSGLGTSPVTGGPDRLIAVSRQKGLQPKVRGAFRDPDWAFWELGVPAPAPDCGVMRIEVDKFGVPTDVGCELAASGRTGESRWRSWWGGP